MIKIKQPQVGAIKDYHTILPNGLITQNGVSDEVVGTQLILRFHSFKVSDIVNYDTFDPQTDPETAQLLEDRLVPYCQWLGAEDPGLCFLYILFPTNDKFIPKQTGEDPSDLVNLVTTVYDYVLPSVLMSIIEQYEDLDETINQLKAYLTEHGAYGFVYGSGTVYAYLPAFESCSNTQEALDLLDPNSTFTYELETPIIHNLASGGNPYMDFNVVEGGTYLALSVNSLGTNVIFTVDGEDVNATLNTTTNNVDVTGTWKLKKIFGNSEVSNQDELLSVQHQTLKTTTSNDTTLDLLPLNLTTLQGTKSDGTHEVMFPDGLKKAGNVYDEINYSTGKAIKRVESVDLGSFETYSISNGFAAIVTMTSVIKRPSANSVKANIVCAKYQVASRDFLASTTQDNLVAVNNVGNIIIKDSRVTSETTIEQVQSLLSGVLLIYELAEPIEYTIDGFIQEPKRIIASSTEVKTVYAGQTPVWYAYYGWDYNTSTLTVTRIGNTTWHKELPIQSKMRRCAVKDDGTVKYISSWDYTKYEDGNTVDYAGGDGQIMVEIPEYYYEAYEETVDGVVHKILKLYPYAQIGQKSKKFYCGAFEGITDDASSNTPKLYSISTLTGGTKDGSGNYLAANWTYTTNAADYRGSGGTNDNGIKSNWSRPRTSLTITNFRDRATNRGTGWSQQYFTAYNSILRLYTVEYCNFNSQAAFTSTLTAAGYHQGGFGNGVTNANSSDWSSFNSYNPFIPCGVTKELGSNTGIIGVTYASGEFASSAYTTYVPSYRGIENPFGHIWKWTDGYTKYGEDSTATVYTCDDITKFSDSVTNQNVPDGYSAKGTHSIGEGNFGDWYWNSDGTFVHKTFGTGPFSDYTYHNNIGTCVLRSGGGAYSGAAAGLFYWATTYAPSNVYAYLGGRLYYTPSEN